VDSPHPTSWTHELSSAAQRAPRYHLRQLDQLLPGGSFVILNDHDPKPLRYQTEALWPGRFGWSYLEPGPLQWRVEITRAA